MANLYHCSLSAKGHAFHLLQNVCKSQNRFSRFWIRTITETSSSGKDCTYHKNQQKFREKFRIDFFAKEGGFCNLLQSGIWCGVLSFLLANFTHQGENLLIHVQCTCKSSLEFPQKCLKIGACSVQFNKI